MAQREGLLRSSPSLFLLVHRAKHATLGPIFRSLVHPHQSFFDVRQSTCVLSGVIRASLKRPEPVSDNLKQISVKNAMLRIRVFARPLLELNNDERISVRGIIICCINIVLMVRSPRPDLSVTVYCIEVIALLNC